MNLNRHSKLTSETSFAALSLVALNLFMHYVHCSLWIAIVTALALIWRSLNEFFDIRLPSKILRNIIYILAFSYLISVQHTIFGIEAGLNSLVLAAGLKLLEAEGYTDLMNMFMICILLLMGKLLYSQTFLMTLVLFIDVAAIIGFMYKLHAVEYKKVSLARMIGPSIRLFIWAAPLMVFLFVFFPRIQTRFIPNPIKKPLVGFSNTLEPGLISELAESDHLAFRVRFLGKSLPSPAGMYWRGGVLAKSKGMSWYKDPILELIGKRYQQNENDNVILQTIIMEPTFNEWLFALDFPTSLTFQDFQLQRLLQRSAGGTFILGRALYKQSVYNVSSSSNLLFGELSSRERQIYLQTDPNISEDVHDLVNKWKGESVNAEDFPNLALDYFRKKGFTYTLQPGILATNTLSEFLFRKKRGFCEHYASAFATLMRLGGLPSRVVIGFQGGRYNPYDEMYTVTSKDAHAWAEVWSEKTHSWMRYDPTNVVAPERIQMGGQEYFRYAQDANTTGESIKDLASRASNVFFRSFLQVRLIGDALTSRWDLFLLNYDFDFQKRILEKWGFENVNPGDLLALTIVVILFFGLFLIIRNQLKLWNTDPMVHIMRRFKKLAAKQGIHFDPSDGFISVFEKTAESLPDSRPEIEEFGVAYMRARYKYPQQKNDLQKHVTDLKWKLDGIAKSNAKKSA